MASKGVNSVLMEGEGITNPLQEERRTASSEGNRKGILFWQ